MNKYYISVIKNNLFYIFLLIYIILGIYLLKYYQYDTINRDLVVIISISNQYAMGNYYDAINGYWGPLLSWLLFPFIIFNSTPEFAVYLSKILSILIGFFTIIGIRSLSYRFKMREEIRYSLLFASIFIVLYFGLRFTPLDILLTCFLVFYLSIIFNPDYSNNQHGILCGIIGSLAYLTKSYAFPFFITHFIFMNTYYYFKYNSNKSNILKNLALGLAIFFIISGAWTTIISIKYNYLTFGTSGKYNFEEVGPVQHYQGCPIWNGFMNPPYESSISAWEDPSYFNLKSWNPFSSFKSFFYLLNLIIKNIYKLIGFLYSISYYFPLILIIYLSFLITPVNKLISAPEEKILPIITIFIFCTGYVLVFTEFRYFFIVYILLMFMGGYLLNTLFNSKFLNKGIISLIIIFFTASLIAMPITSLTNNKHMGKEFYEESLELKEYGIKGNIASNDKYGESLNLAYYLDSRYFGIATNSTTGQKMTDVEFENNLKRYKIDYYIVWNDDKHNQGVLLKYNEITNGKIENLKIYKISQ